MLNSKDLPVILSSSGIKVKVNLLEVLNFREKDLPEWKFCTDSRSIFTNSWFIALKGPNFDGHSFIKKAIESGATGLIISEREKVSDVDLPTLLVKDTLDAYQTIARFHRNFLKPKVIGITGSNGKTTTKEIVFQVLSTKFKCLASEANENNEIGVPKNLLKIDQNVEIFIQEMGMRGLGQIEELVKIAEQDYSIITNIGVAHIGILGSKEKIAEAKAEIFIHQPLGTTAIVPRDEPLLLKWKSKRKNDLKFLEFGGYENPKFINGEMRFSYRNNEYCFKSPNIALIDNCCAAIDLAIELGLTHAQIQYGLNQYEAQAGRGKLIKLQSGAILIDETYNANPDSVEALAKSMKILCPNKRKVIFLGEMAELDWKEEELMNWLQYNIVGFVDEVVFIGGKASPIEKLPSLSVKYFNKKETAEKYIFKNSQQYLSEGCLIGVKGSRMAKMETLIDSFRGFHFA
ncbi:MAG: UDP-N-acetylmuramoyl-tripeptide--D-alanyl-D-alanine ligase [Candidatus Caenarcaniphilales bacterium]|nr:UDP-N-acetylmuramoyl-tripeptide--D-alanyl-D-alanine ligase [Candidatus Caenarcaniphilales bacterium]